MIRKNELGNNYGNLKVVSCVGKVGKHIKWKCLCNCGNEIFVLGSNLRNGSTQSCGCKKRKYKPFKKIYKSLINEKGKRYGKLIVLGKIFVNERNKWLCQCDCGNKTIVSGSDLRLNKIKSCGCFLKEWRDSVRLPEGKTNFHFLLKQIKNNAKKRNIIYNLTDEQVESLVKQNCYYCGIEPKQIMKQRKSGKEFLYNGLDRINNDGLYSLENVVPACKKCNFAKGSMTINEFKIWIKQICKYNSGV